MDFKSFDWRSLQRYFSAQASSDLNDFLEKLPQKAGQTVLVAAGMAWAAGLTLGLYTTVQTQSLIEVRSELQNVSTLKPLVPVIRNVPVPQAEINNFGSSLATTYPDIVVKAQGPSLYLSSQTTALFGQFREAIGHVQNGGDGWQVSMDRLCVGRECDREKLAVLLKISKVSVDKPQ